MAPEPTRDGNWVLRAEREAEPLCALCNRRHWPVSECPPTALRDDDIGRCDLCGSEAGHRFSDGAWLCDSCSGVPVNETDADWIENRGVDSYDLVDPRWL